ncbi:MAG: hypothetical protein GNW80_12305 [Asgard group archaeon]|nr:hypothetical protein [Asgard group archaeon]
MFSKGDKYKRKFLVFLFFFILLAPLPSFSNSAFSSKQEKYYDSELLYAFETQNLNLVKSLATTNNYSLISQWNGSLGSTFDVFVVDEFAYLADKDGGLVILDITNLTQPREIGRKAIAGDIVGAVNLFIENDYAYIANDVDGARIIDISNKSEPKLISEYHDELYYWDVYVSGNYAFYTTIGDGLEIINVSNKAIPNEIAQYNMGGFIWSVWGSENYIYITDLNTGLEIINVTEITTPTKVGFHDVYTGQPFSVFVEEDVAFIAVGNEGLELVNISEKSSLVKLSQFKESGSIVDVHSNNDTVFLADKFNGLKILDISNKSNPVKVGSYSLSGDSWNVFYQEEVVYLANGQNGLAIIGIDRDNDDLADYLELEIYDTDPLNPDSDGDGFHDGYEIEMGTNPNDPNDYPIIPSPSPTETSGFKYGLIFVISFIFIKIFFVIKINKRKNKLK